MVYESLEYTRIEHFRFKVEACPEIDRIAEDVVKKYGFDETSVTRGPSYVEVKGSGSDLSITVRLACITPSDMKEYILAGYIVVKICPRRMAERIADDIIEFIEGRVKA